MAEEFFKRRRRSPVIVRNPVAPEAFSSTEQTWPSVPGRFKIVYTGSVYHAQSDAFINLLGALDEMQDWSLHIYTSQSEARLAAYEIQGPKVVRHQHVDQVGSYAATGGGCPIPAARLPVDHPGRASHVCADEDGRISRQRASDPGARAGGYFCCAPYSPASSGIRRRHARQSFPRSGSARTFLEFGVAAVSLRQCGPPGGRLQGGPRTRGFLEHCQGGYSVNSPVGKPPPSGPQ